MENSQLLSLRILLLPHLLSHFLRDLNIMSIGPCTMSICLMLFFIFLSLSLSLCLEIFYWFFSSLWTYFSSVSNVLSNLSIEFLIWVIVFLSVLEFPFDSFKNRFQFSGETFPSYLFFEYIIHSYFNLIMSRSESLMGLGLDLSFSGFFPSCFSHIWSCLLMHPYLLFKC